MWSTSLGRYVAGLRTLDQPYNAGIYYNLSPAYYNEEWGPLWSKSLRMNESRLFNHDPMLPGTWWWTDHHRMLRGEPSYHQRYSGAGAFVGIHPIMVELLGMDGRLDAADRLLARTLELVDDTGLIAEHINTIALGRELSSTMDMFPDPTSFIDRGNLMHLSFMLRMLNRLAGIQTDFGREMVLLDPWPLEHTGRVTVEDAPLPGRGMISFEATREPDGRVSVRNFKATDANRINFATGVHLY
jgi:hypothetical protein